MDEIRVGLFGATSLLGTCLLLRLAAENRPVTVYSRQDVVDGHANVDWRHIPVESGGQPEADVIPLWVCVAPIWVLPQYFELMLASGARRVVAVSSTSRFTKQASLEPSELQTVAKLEEGERRLQEWAERNAIEWIILRPTLIYGLGRDQNVSVIARFIRRYKFFPVFGQASGLRQPVHADDVAAACLAALCSTVANRSYNISGGETLSYRQMVYRVFERLGSRPCLLHVPLPVFAAAIRLLRVLPRCRHWNTAMTVRMNQDLVFSHDSAAQDLGYSPRPFRLDPGDLGIL